LASTTTRRPPRRFLPPSRNIEEPYRLTPRLALRLAILGVLTIAVFGALVLRLWALQVLQGTQYLRTAQNNQLRSLPVQAPRGPILDRNGTPLVTNTAATGVELWPADLPKRYADRYYELRRLAGVLRVPLYEISADLKRHGNDPLNPVTIKEAASDAEVAFLKERENEFPGVQVASTYIRHYPYQSLAAQVLGYVGEISPQELKHMKGYKAGDVIGQIGVEAKYDGYLRGHDGQARMRVDARGHPVSDLTVTDAATPGHALRLTIDLKLQQATERALDYGIRTAQAQGQWAARGGAIVALDPRNGAILSMASAPTYKPSVFAGHVTTKALAAAGLTNKTAAEKNYPGIDRVLAGTYPPGSTWKPVTAIAAIENHILSPYANYACTGSYTSHGQKFANWDPFVSAQIDLPTALEISCDTYFYALGEQFYRLPSTYGHPLQNWARRLGFGSLTGVDVGPEAAGLVPTPEWRQRHFRYAIDKLWKPGNSIQLAIGQGDLLVTPLQMARFYALIANGGKLVTPHVLFDVEDPNGQVLPTKALASPMQINVDPAGLQAIRAGLYAATHAPLGTSYGVFGGFQVPVAGKTGTAEKVVTLPGYTGIQNQSWWCGYGPFDDPKLVVCAVIENGGHGGTAAAPAALKVFEQYFNVQAGQQGIIHSD
jgi:penicillin-binding protein 2